MAADEEKGMVNKESSESGVQEAPYQAVFGDVSYIIDEARKAVARSVNATLTAACWMIGRRIVEFEQSGEELAEYGSALIRRLAEDLTRTFGRGFSRQNLQNMRQFYLLYPPEHICQTVSGISEVTSSEVGYDELVAAFPLPWSAYVRLLSVGTDSARKFYETEAVVESHIR